MNLEEFVGQVKVREGHFKNISELGIVESKEMLNLREEEAEINGKKTTVCKFNIKRDDNEFEVSLPWGVVKSLQEYLKKDLKVTKFEVAKTTEGGRNKYTLVVIESERKPKAIVVENVQ